jgi:hypothetical protein
MVEDLSDVYKELRDMKRRLARIESGSAQESMSVDRGRMRIGDGEFLVDGDGLFRLVGTFDQTGVYNLNAGGVFNVNTDGDLNVNSGGDVTVNDGGGIAVNGGGDLDINSGGNARVNGGGGLGIWDGGVVRVHTGGVLDVLGNAYVSSGGSLKVNGGGEIVVDGPEPITIKQFSIAGLAGAAIQFGDSYVMADGGILALYSPNAVSLNSAEVTIPQLPSGAGEYLVTADAAGKLYKTPRGGDGGGGDTDPPDLNPEGYIWPVSASKWGVSSSWQDHKNRNPPSAEPGTDVACPYGTNVYAPADGEITQVYMSTVGATGRYVAMKTDGGAWFRFLHLSSSPVAVGQTVNQGDVVAVSGASGFGSDYGYGAHCHITFWSGPSASMPSFSATEDFEAYMAAQGAA